MKRLVWLLLLVCTAAFARVQPFELPVDTEACCCCEKTGTCDMPDCAPPPATAMVALDRPATTQQSAPRRQRAPSALPAISTFYAYFAPTAPAVPTLGAHSGPATPTTLPLRVTQCQWLI